MRPRMLLPAFLVVLLFAPAASAFLVPMAGVVREGESRRHAYDGSQGGLVLCLMVGTVGYTVTLVYSPASDVLTLSVEGRGSVEGRDGRATLSFVGGPCASFPVTVAGTRVATAAAYDVYVTESRGA